MPVKPTYPGVYIEEVASGVRTITGASTSVTAFLGAAKRGPINSPVRLTGFADFERAFGGLDGSSQMSYAVRQFFLNGGTQAWAVRLTKDSSAAFRDIPNSNGVNVIKVTALEEGKSGNEIEIRIDYDTLNPDSTFNLTANYLSVSNRADARSEQFTNLSMNSSDPDGRYIIDQINGISKLIKVEVHPPQGSASAGTSTSGALVDQNGALLDVATLVDDTHNELRVSVNNSDAVTLVLNPSTDLTGTTNDERLAALCSALNQRAQEAAPQDARFGAKFCGVAGKSIVFTSGVPGVTSAVRVLAGQRNDVSARLMLGVLNGGKEVDGAAGFRPKRVPDPATLTGTALSDNDVKTKPDANQNRFQITLDGYGPEVIELGTTAATGTNLAEKLEDLASRIQAAVRKARSIPAYSGFTCTSDGTRLTLSTGTRGAGGSVLVSEAQSNGIGAALHLLGQSSPSPNFMLEKGTETQLDPAAPYSSFIASRAARKGIYALEAVEEFNIMVLPGITDSGTLADAAAYCAERRAFLVADCVKGKSPTEMEKDIRGTALPKTKNAAVYYPWIHLPNPLKGGKLEAYPPSGTIAGLMARTDSERGVWKAPAGTEAALVGVQKLDYVLTDAECGILNPRGVNCLRLMPGYGPISWGARTLRGDDDMGDEWKYVPVRRTALFIEQSLYVGTKWVVFEPNDEPLWAQIRLNIGAFMHSLFRQGAFQGKTPKEAYLVKCDRETTTQDDINKGVVNILVGFAPLKPAEFVMIKLQQLAGQLQA